MRIALLVCLACLSLLARGAPVPLTLTYTGNLGGLLELQTPVEQQTQGGATQPDQNLWVTNPTGTPWDIDDRHLVTDKGYLDPGQSASFTEYMVADWANTHILGIEVTSERSSDLFTASVRVDDAAGTVVTITSTLPHVVNGIHGKFADTMTALFSFFYWQNSPKLVPIPNSGFGGIGRVLAITWTVTNTDSHRITLTAARSIVSGQLSIYMNYWCPEGNPFLNSQHVFGETSYAWCQAASVQ